MGINLDILEHLVASELPELKFIGFDKLGSTNAYLYSDLEWHDPIVCIAKQQTAGYGQRGRSWLSNDQSLTLSLGLTSSLPLKDSSALPLYVGLRLCAVINTVCTEAVSIKWPNDLYVGNNKIAGLLIETKTSNQNRPQYIIGFGLNLSTMQLVETDNVLANTAGYVTSSLSHEALALSLIACIKQAFDEFPNVTVDRWLDLFTKYDHFEKGEEVIVYHNGQTITGQYAGVSEFGELLVSQDGQIHSYISGATSIRTLNDE